MKRTDLAYVAGIVDGEGYIGIGTRSRPGHKYPDLSLRVSVTNSDMWLLQMLKMGFGGTIRQKTAGKIPQRMPVWDWTIERAHAAEFLKLIVPYLHLKRPQAELGIQFQSARGQHTTRHSEERRAVAEAQRIMLKGMKHSKTT